MAGWDVDVSGIESTAAAIDERAADMEGAVYICGTNVEYAIFQEKGTSEISPNPFLQPAIDTVMAERADSLADEADGPADLVRRIAFAIEGEAKHFASTGVPPGPDEVTSNLKNSIRAERIG
jgi:hypothetical protein